MIRVVSKKESLDSQLSNAKDFVCIDCTSRNPSEFWAKGLSPFYLGPIECYKKFKNRNYLKIDIE